MSYFLVFVGVTTICYEIVAHLIGLPKLSDLLPVDFLHGNTDSEFYKIVPSDRPDNEAWFVFGVGLFFIALGLCVKYAFQR